MLITSYFGAQEIQWASRRRIQQLIICILLIQLVAVWSIFFDTRASAKFGNIKTLIVYFLGFALLVCLFITLPIHFLYHGSLGLVWEFENHYQDQR
jgi:UMF1 family MFS transporter